MKLPAIVFLSFAFHESLAQVFGPGKCPEVKTQESFDLNKYLGDWYEIVRFKAGFEDGTKCTIANYQIKEDGHIRVDNKGVSLENTSVIVEAVGDAYTPDEKEPAKLQVKFAEGIPYGNYWILDTDYTNYTLIYSCKAILGLTHVEFCWILSRERTLAAETKERLYDTLENFGVKTENFMETIQTGCDD